MEGLWNGVEQLAFYPKEILSEVNKEVFDNRNKSTFKLYSKSVIF